MLDEESKADCERILKLMEQVIVPFVSDACLTRNGDVLEYLEHKGVANLDETTRLCHEGKTDETRTLLKKGLSIDFLFVLFDRFNLEMIAAAKREKQNEQCEPAKALASRLDIN